MNPPTRFLLLLSPTRRRMAHLMDLRTFCAVAANCLQAGLPLPLTLEALLGHLFDPSPAFKAAVEEVAADVTNRMTLSSAMRRHPKVFPTALWTMVDVWECVDTDATDADFRALAALLRAAGNFYADEHRYLQGQLLFGR